MLFVERGMNDDIRTCEIVDSPYPYKEFDADCCNIISDSQITFALYCLYFVRPAGRDYVVPYFIRIHLIFDMGG